MLDSWTTPKASHGKGIRQILFRKQSVTPAGFPISICGEFCLLAGNWLTAPCWNWQPLRDSFSFSASSDDAQSKGANEPQEQHVLPSNMPGGKLGLEKAECSVVSWSHVVCQACCPALSLLIPSIAQVGCLCTSHSVMQAHLIYYLITQIIVSLCLPVLLGTCSLKVPLSGVPYSIKNGPIGA